MSSRKPKTKEQIEALLIRADASLQKMSRSGPNKVREARTFASWLAYARDHKWDDLFKTHRTLLLGHVKRLEISHYDVAGIIDVLPVDTENTAQEETMRDPRLKQALSRSDEALEKQKVPGYRSERMARAFASNLLKLRDQGDEESYGEWQQKLQEHVKRLNIADHQVPGLRDGYKQAASKRLASPAVSPPQQVPTPARTNSQIGGIPRQAEEKKKKHAREPTTSPEPLIGGPSKSASPSASQNPLQQNRRAQIIPGRQLSRTPTEEPSRKRQQRSTRPSQSVGSVQNQGQKITSQHDESTRYTTSSFTSPQLIRRPYPESRRPGLQIQAQTQPSQGRPPSQTTNYSGTNTNYRAFGSYQAIPPHGQDMSRLQAPQNTYSNQSGSAFQNNRLTLQPAQNHQSQIPDFPGGGSNNLSNASNVYPKFQCLDCGQMHYTSLECARPKGYKSSAYDF